MSNRDYARPVPSNDLQTNDRQSNDLQSNELQSNEETRTSVRTAAVVLAAGGGRRFRASLERVGPGAGSNAGADHKLLADFRGKPLVARAIQAAYQASFERLYVVAGAADLHDVVDKTTDGNGVVLHNDRWDSGQASSLRLAADIAAQNGFEAIVVGLGDQPLVPSEAWRAVADAPGEIVVATFNGDRRPPVKLSASVWADLPTEGDEGARKLIRVRPELVSEVACIGNPVDIDTIEDLDQWN